MNVETTSPRLVIHVVVGMGEIGSAIAQVLRDPDPQTNVIHEVWPTDQPRWGNPPFYPDHTDALHICFPYTDDFETIVRMYQHRYQPIDTIIHSTVPVGTSRRLNATHSPVSGRHPSILRDLGVYTKFFGGPTYAAALRASFHFKICAVRVQTVPDSEGTEAGKLLATLQFGWLIAMQKEIKAYCEAVGANYDVAYRSFNEMYNQGMEQLGEDLRLSVLTDIPGPIGGHCVVPNLELIPEHRLAALLRIFNQRWTLKAASTSKVSPEKVP